MKKTMHPSAKDGGFSLVELIIVIAIMVALVAILAPQYFQYVEKSRAAICLTNRQEALHGYTLAIISDYDNDQTKRVEAMDASVVSLGGERSGALQYTGLCPTGGTVTAVFAQDGSITMTCDKHPVQTAGLAENIMGILSNNDLKRGNQTIKEYLSGNDKVIDSEAPDTDNAGETWRKLMSDELAKIPGLDTANNSWRVRYYNGQYVIFVTTDGKVTNADNGKTVAATRYAFDADGKLVEKTDANVKVSIKNGYAVINPA